MDTVEIERFVTGPLDTNTYVVSRDIACLVVDPSSNCVEVIRHIERKQLKVDGIVITHGHFDHVLGISELRKKYCDVGVWIHPAEVPLLRLPQLNGSTMFGSPWSFTDVTHDLVEPETVIGSFTVGVRHIPGHSPGGVALLFNGNCLPGDVIFALSIGRTDLPGGDFDKLINGIREKILSLPDDTILWPGHGNRTTVGRERRANPFLQ